MLWQGTEALFVDVKVCKQKVSNGMREGNFSHPNLFISIFKIRDKKRKTQICFCVSIFLLLCSLR